MDMRKIALEVIPCRHCNKIIHSSEKHLCDALLCQDCFNSRAAYRGKNPLACDEKAEWNFMGDLYGKKRAAKTVVCAGCEQIYQLVPSDCVDVSVEEQKKHYDNTFVFHKGKKPFKPFVFNYQHAPKGWTNNILCKACFENLPQVFSSEIVQVTQEKQIEKERLAARDKAILEEKKEKESLAGITKENPIGAIGFGLLVAASAIALLKFMNAGVTDGWSAASKESPFGKIIFFIILGIIYLASIPWLRGKGGGYRELSVVMSWLAGIAFAIFVISIMPSCDTDRNLNSQGELPYYRK